MLQMIFYMVLNGLLRDAPDMWQISNSGHGPTSTTFVKPSRNLINFLQGG